MQCLFYYPCAPGQWLNYTGGRVRYNPLPAWTRWSFPYVRFRMPLKMKTILSRGFEPVLHVQCELLYHCVSVIFVELDWYNIIFFTKGTSMLYNQAKLTKIIGLFLSVWSKLSYNTRYYTGRSLKSRTLCYINIYGQSDNFTRRNVYIIRYRRVTVFRKYLSPVIWKGVCTLPAVMRIIL